jgi:benzoate-CoA ligase
LRIRPFSNGPSSVRRTLTASSEPHAFVALRPEVGAKGLERALQALAREKLATYKCPRWVTFVPDLPKTATGKIQRYLLRQEQLKSKSRRAEPAAARTP